jgi:hypothetical protein
MSEPWLGSDNAALMAEEPSAQERGASCRSLSTVRPRPLQLVGLGGLAPETTPEAICCALQERIPDLELKEDNIDVIRSEDTGECMGAALVVLPNTTSAAILLDGQFQVKPVAVFAVHQVH